jgi:TonB family protein
MNRYILFCGPLVFASMLCSSMAASREDALVLKVKEFHAPAFPLPLLLRGVITGKVEAVVSIDPDGRAVDNLVVAYTQPELARSALELLKNCVFDPVLIDGEPAAVRAKVFLTFDAQGVVVSLTATETLDNIIERLHGERTHNHVGKIAELDRAPVVTKTVQPRYPAKLADRNISGRATIDFFVDENGKVRMPTRVRSDHDEFAQASADALMEWQFTPLTRNGQPVIVEMKQEFVFTPKS